MIIPKWLLLIFLGVSLLSQLSAEDLRETMDQLNIHLDNSLQLKRDGFFNTSVSFLGASAIAAGTGLWQHLESGQPDLNIETSYTLGLGAAFFIRWGLFLFISQSTENLITAYQSLPEKDEHDLGYKISGGENLLKSMAKTARTFKYTSAPLVIISGISLGLINNSGIIDTKITGEDKHLLNLIAVFSIVEGINYIFFYSNIDLEYDKYKQWKTGREIRENQHSSWKSDVTIFPEGPALVLTCRL